jgi:hypothetical protein
VFSYYIYLPVLKDTILKIVPSNQHSAIEKYIEDYLTLLRSKIEQCEVQLTAQVSSCPSALFPLEIVDKKLKEFVRLHHIDLSRTINYQVNKIKSITSEKQLFKQLSFYYLTTDHVMIINQISYIFHLSYFLV